MSCRGVQRCCLASLLCVFSFESARAFADTSKAASASNAPAAVLATATAPALPPPRSQPQAIQGKVLPEWVDVRTGSVSRHSSICGHLIEASLSGSPRQNYLDLTLLNQSETDATYFYPQAVTAHFGSGLTRRLGPELSRLSDLTSRGDRWIHASLGFPSKAEFEHEERLRIEFSIDVRGQDPCNASLEFVRRRDIQVPESSYTSYARGQVNSGLTLHFAATGNLRTIASNVNPGFDLSWMVFPWVHQGLGFEFGVDAFGSRGLPEVVPDRDSNAVVGVFAMFTYSYRIHLSPRLTPQYDLGAGVYGLSVDSAEGNDRLASAFCPSVREKLKLNILLFTSSDGRVELAPALVHTYIPAGDFGSTSVSGNLFSGALYLVIGP